MSYAKFFILLLSVFAMSCGYGFQGKTNPWTAQGVETVYVEIMTNNSLKAGLEVPFTSSFVKTFSRGNKLRVVNDQDRADVIVKANIESYGSAISSTTTVPSITQETAAKVLDDFQIATEYVASATVAVSIVRRNDHKQLASQSFSRQRVYPANNRFGLQGTTSVLINDSQLQLALNEIAGSIAGDVYDLMLEVF